MTLAPKLAAPASAEGARPPLGRPGGRRLTPVLTSFAAPSKGARPPLGRPGGRRLTPVLTSFAAPSKGARPPLGRPGGRPARIRCVH